jgi:MarR family transcriptional regulator for hemolysin
MKPVDQNLLMLTSAMLRLGRAYRQHADRAVSDFGVSQASAWPLVILGRMGGGIRQGVLAEAIGVEGPSLVPLIDQLCAAGLLERREDPLDRRAKTLHLTDAGKTLTARIETVLQKVRRQLFKGVAENDIEATLRVFAALETTLGRTSGTGRAGEA